MTPTPRRAICSPKILSGARGRPQKHSGGGWVIRGARTAPPQGGSRRALQETTEAPSSSRLSKTPYGPKTLVWVPEGQSGRIFSGCMFEVWPAPGARESLPKCGGRSPPYFGGPSWAPGAGQDLKNAPNKIRPDCLQAPSGGTRNPCIPGIRFTRDPVYDGTRKMPETWVIIPGTWIPPRPENMPNPGEPRTRVLVSLSFIHQALGRSGNGIVWSSNPAGFWTGNRRCLGSKRP